MKLVTPQWMILLIIINDSEVKLFNEKFENDTTATFLTKKTGFNYSNIEKNLKMLEKKGYITTTKKKRSRIISLTEKGREASFHLCKIRVMLNYNNI